MEWIGNRIGVPGYCPEGIVVGEPKATKAYSVEELKAIGAVGIYLTCEESRGYLWKVLEMKAK